MPAALFDVLILGVALAVAAVPEGLPAVVTAVLSIGVQRMARRNAIVRHLAAVETLGSATVIASDKTGTLTKNEMTVRVVVTASGRVNFDGSGYAPDGAVQAEGGRADRRSPLRVELERALPAADRANNACGSGGRRPVDRPGRSDGRRAARRRAQSRPELGRSRRATPARRRSAVLVRAQVDEHGAPRCASTRTAAWSSPRAPRTSCWRGAHAKLVGEERRPLTPERRAAILETNEALAGQALRTLGVAGRWLTGEALAEHSAHPDERVEQDLAFAGLIGIIDPPRAEARDAVARARHAGIRPIMITGDHPRTASVIARELGISVDGRDDDRGGAGDSCRRTRSSRTAAEVSVYARVNPEHKLRIVDALKRSGAVVAMTGDGVNDAPALKKADIGVAMGITGTDVSKEAADMVLSDDNFASIVAAVEEGRAIFANIRKFLRYLLSSNIGEVMTMFFGVVLARQIGLEGGEGASCCRCWQRKFSGSTW